MNILLLIPRFNVGGAESHVLRLAILLKGKGYNVYLASGGGQLTHKLRALNIPTFFLPIRLSTDISAFFLARIIKKYHIQIVHSHSAAAGITALKCKKRYCHDVPVMYTAHGNFGNAKEKILCQADAIIAVSKCVKSIALKNGCPHSKVHLIYIGINNKIFFPRPIDTDLRQKYTIPPDAFCLAVVARIKNLRNKGHGVLLDIMQSPQAKNWHLIVLGSGKGEWKLLRQIQKLHLTKRIHFLGRKNDVAPYVAMADVITLPSYFETFGLSIAEGMAMGKPAVAYAVGGITEIITDKKDGFLIPYGQKELLLQKLDLLAINKTMRTQMGLAATKNITASFSETVMFEKITALYRDIIS